MANFHVGARYRIGRVKRASRNVIVIVIVVIIVGRESGPRIFQQVARLSPLSEFALSHTLMVIYEHVAEPRALIACNLYAWVI